MDSAVIDDLKQFIDVTIVTRVTEVLDRELDRKLEEKLEEKLEAKLEVKLEAKLEAKLNQKFDERLIPMEARLNNKIDTLARSVAEAIDASNDANDRWLRNHERRIRRLEARSI